MANSRNCFFKSIAYTDWMLVAAVGGGLRTLDCRCGAETDDGDEIDAFVRSLLAITARSSFCKQPRV